MHIFHLDRLKVTKTSDFLLETTHTTLKIKTLLICSKLLGMNCVQIHTKENHTHHCKTNTFIALFRI